MDGVRLVLAVLVAARLVCGWRLDGVCVWLLSAVLLAGAVLRNHSILQHLCDASNPSRTTIQTATATLYHLKKVSQNSRSTPLWGCYVIFSYWSFLCSFYLFTEYVNN